MSTPRTASEIREAFLRFFESKAHTRVGSSSLVPVNDPTILFTNAGMNQFKDVFTGRETRDYKRATTSQKCVRAGGKHNDLDNVGHTARHHTFFEMLGNFSFGDYFKKDAIAFAWEFMTSKEWLALDVSRLAVTIFEGEGKIPADDEAAQFWRDQGVRPERIFRLGKKDNFWSMGEVGPCGPCSEIHIYRGKETELAFIDRHAQEFFAGKVEDSDSWMELWNLVFMQFEVKEKDGDYLPLPKPSIDTGAGLERLAAVAQGVGSNYETDLLKNLVDYAGELSNRKSGASAEDDVAMRVIADHSRATTFLIADGVLPSNEGRGYVLRRIMRRAIRFGSKLGLNELFLFKTAERVIELMGAAYPELKQQRAFVIEVARNEELSFRRTLAAGLKLLEEETAKLGKAGTKEIPGKTVFFLHDTHGFPPDVTEQVAREHGFSVDMLGYEAEMERQRAQGSGAGGGSDQKKIADVYFALHGKTGDSTFLGYETQDTTGAKVLAVLHEGAEISQAPAGSVVEIVVDRTPFYGESGGQVGDAGTAKGPSVELEIEDAQKPVAGLVVHRARVKSGILKPGDVLELHVDGKRRSAIRANHSATHLLHQALKEVLGEHVKQAGSVVAPEQLRFDFSHFAPVKPEELMRIERRVNTMIRDNREATTKVMPIEEAKKTGAVSMFGEKYGASVRVVSVHPDSLEFCGGTHVRRAGDIGLFKILSEAGVAQGVRRIEAVTGAGALDYVRRLEAELGKAGERLKAPTFEVAARVDKLLADARAVDQEVDTLSKKLASSRSDDLLSQAREVKGMKVLSARIEGADPKIFRDVADKLRDKLASGIVVLGGEKDGKVLILAAATKDVVAKGFKAGDLVKELAKDIGGSGGGKPDMAQAGGTDASKLDAALARVFDLV